MILKANAKAQAKLLSQELAARQMTIGHQDVLDLVAKLQGFRSWLEFATAAEKAEAYAKLSAFAKLCLKLKNLLNRF